MYVRLIIERQQAEEQRDLMIISSPTSSGGGDELLEEYTRMKAKEVQIQSPSSSPPPSLPDIQLVMSYIINGKQLEVQKQVTIEIKCNYGSFLYHIGTLCNAKLPSRQKFNSDGIRVIFERAWITASELKAHRKKKQITMMSFDDEFDFLALKCE